MINKVRCYDYDELNNDLLKQFSEGSKALENLLKFCYQNHIVTRACCIGHNKAKESPFPYVAISINEEQYKLMEHVFNQLFDGIDFKNSIKVDIQKEENNMLLAISFRYNEEKLREGFFNIINESLKNYSVENNIIQGKYDNILSAYDILYNEDKIVEMIIKSDGISATKEEIGYFKDVNGVKVETTKEDAEIYAPISEEVFKIKTEDIETYINKTMDNNKKLN